MAFNPAFYPILFKNMYDDDSYIETEKIDGGENVDMKFTESGELLGKKIYIKDVNGNGYVGMLATMEDKGIIIYMSNMSWWFSKQNIIYIRLAKKDE